MLSQTEQYFLELVSVPQLTARLQAWAIAQHHAMPCHAVPPLCTTPPRQHIPHCDPRLQAWAIAQRFEAQAAELESSIGVLRRGLALLVPAPAPAPAPAAAATFLRL